jgi:hypothetical protein
MPPYAMPCTATQESPRLKGAKGEQCGQEASLWFLQVGLGGAGQDYLV